MYSTSVFKYYTPEEYNFDAMRESYFFLCKARHLNDPFELSFSLFTKLDINKNRCFKYGCEPLKDYGICCFTNDPLNKMMWAMYANDYKGFVVEFDKNFLIDFDPTAFVLERDNLKTLKPLEIPRLFYEKVEYIDKFNDLNADDYQYTIMYYGDKKVNLKITKTNDEHDIEYLFVHLCRIKEKRTWQQERENRLIAGRDMMV